MYYMILHDHTLIFIFSNTDLLRLFIVLKSERQMKKHTSQTLPWIFLLNKSLESHQLPTVKYRSQFLACLSVCLSMCLFVCLFVCKQAIMVLSFTRRFCTKDLHEDRRLLNRELLIISRFVSS